MKKKTICAMMTGFLAVQGMEVHAETQQMTGEVESVLESMEMEKTSESEEKLSTDEKSDAPEVEEEISADENTEMEDEPEETEKLLPPTVIPDPEKEPAEKWEAQEEETTDEISPDQSETELDGVETEFPEPDETEPEWPESGESAGKELDFEDSKMEESEPENPEPAGQNPEEEKTEKEEKKSEELKSEKSQSEEEQENPNPAEAELEKPTIEETELQKPKAEAPNTENTKPEDLKQEEQPKAEPNTEEPKPESPLPAEKTQEVTTSPDDTPLQKEESSPPSAETSSESEAEEPSEIPPQIIADFLLSKINAETYEAPKTLTIRPADISTEVDPGYTPEILLEGDADTAEILSCMVNGAEADYEWKENKICLKAESLSEGYNRITVKVRDTNGIVRTMKPWEVNVKSQSPTAVSCGIGRKSAETGIWKSLRRLWDLIRTIAEIQNETARYLRALCRR